MPNEVINSSMRYNTITFNRPMMTIIKSLL